MVKKNYYEILGVPEEADKKEIKRAYFKLVRVYSPEKNPEKFQEIREAYEVLMADDNKENLKAFEFPDSPFAVYMLERTQELMKVRNYPGAAAVAEEANSAFGETEGFLYYLALAQRLAGNSGKSVKNFEKLVKLFPNKILYRKELASSYMERGYGKKAYAAFEEAYAMGCREDEFLLLFSICCGERENDRRAEEILLEMIRKERQSLRDSMLDLIEAFVGLFIINARSGGGNLLEIITGFRKFIGDAAAYIKEYEKELGETAAAMLMACIIEEGKIVPEAELIIEELRSRIPESSFDKLLEEVISETQNAAFDRDERLSDTMKNGYSAFINAPEIYEDESQLVRFIQMDAMLCILEEWPENRAEFDVIETDYPDFYKLIQGFKESLEKGKKDFLRSRFLKDYDRLNANIDGGIYYDKYPQRKRGAEEVKWDSLEEGSFIRTGKKIGRNDTCPCGSGKKYKNCCGKNR